MLYFRGKSKDTVKKTPTNLFTPEKEDEIDSDIEKIDSSDHIKSPEKNIPKLLINGEIKKNGRRKSSNATALFSDNSDSFNSSVDSENYDSSCSESFSSASSIHSFSLDKGFKKKNKSLKKFTGYDSLSEDSSNVKNLGSVKRKVKRLGKVNRRKQSADDNEKTDVGDHEDSPQQLDSDSKKSLKNGSKETTYSNKDNGKEEHDSNGDIESSDQEKSEVSDNSSFGLSYIKELFSTEKGQSRKEKKKKKIEKKNRLLSASSINDNSDGEASEEKRKFSVPFFNRKSNQSTLGADSDSIKINQSRSHSEVIIRGEKESTPVGRREKLIGKIFGDDVDNSEIKKFLKKSEKQWFLEPEYIKFDLSFDMEGKVNGGTWSALIEYLTPPGRVREDFNRAFMITFRVFATGKLLTEALIKRYNLEEPLNLSQSQKKVWHEKKEKPLEESSEIYKEDYSGVEETTHLELSKLEKRLSSTSYIQNDVDFDGRDLYGSDSEYSSGSISSPSRKNSPDDHDLAEHEEIKIASKREDSDIAELLRVTIGVDLSFEAYKHLSHIAQIDPEDVASQLTILQSECYCNISPIELIRGEFSKKKGSKALHVKQMSTWSNQISRWVAALILYEKTPEKRSRVIKYFLELGLECLHLKNYDAVLPRKSEGIIKKLQIATDPSRNYYQYRAVLKKSSPPLLPFLGLYLTDLTFICDGNPDMRRRKIVLGTNGISEKEFEMQREKENLIASDIKGPSKDIDIRQKDILINFDKHYKVAQIIMEIQKYQIAYSGNFTMAIPGLQRYILNQIEYWDKENYDDDKLYNLSLEREPRAQMNILNVAQTKSRKKSVSQTLGFK
ncbi:Cell division control protein 25 [Smittium culicis]|uniref:Cell division control protein 25 n=2 Tax=Smittium culicis TaxID=133412 RepID=A0A1R1YIB4_9FUNG|nr:Cell division control protein 25 [Smittium culicis]